MKVKRTLLVLLCSFAALGMLTSVVCAAEQGPYVNIQGGATWVEDADFDGQEPNTEPLFFSGDTIFISGESEFDTGYNVEVAAGYDFGMTRLEAAVSYRENDEDKSSGTASDDLFVYAFEDEGAGEVGVLSFLVNGYLDFENTSPVTPYLGAGIGIANVDVEDDDDTVFAYQFAAGVSFEVSPTVVLDLGYRYFATEDVEFEDMGGDFEAEYVSHNATLGLRFMF